MKSLSRSPKAVAAAVLLAAVASSAWADVAINFDGTNAPCCYSETSPLTNLYSGLGVTFGGVAGAGGSILNQSGHFGFDARSGTDFLAFNTFITSNTEKLSFSSAVTYVEIWAANASINAGSMTMTAYDSNGAQLSSSSVNGSAQWQLLSVSGWGISEVLLTGSGYSYAYDDLAFRVAAPVPEPETYAMMLAGLGLLGLTARRRRRKRNA